MFAAERTARKVAARRRHGPVDIVEVPKVPRPVNSLLTAVSRFDRVVLSRGDLPFGSSVFLAATRTD